MKVKDIVGKINAATCRLPVYVCKGNDERKLSTMDLCGYYYEEKDCTVRQIELRSDKMVIWYK